MENDSGACHLLSNEGVCIMVANRPIADINADAIRSVSHLYGLKHAHLCYLMVGLRSKDRVPMSLMGLL